MINGLLKDLGDKSNRYISNNKHIDINRRRLGLSLEYGSQMATTRVHT